MNNEFEESTARAPEVSVLMPVYNAERYLAEAVESMLAQTWRDFEFVIVDDGSTDASHEMLQRYARQDDRVVLISRPNTGIVGALNDGLEACRGEYVARMDADDVALPDRLAKQVAFLRNHPDHVAVGGGAICTDAEGNALEVRGFELTHDRIYERLLHGHGATILHPTLVMRRSAAVEVGGYRREFQWVEDLDLYLRLGRRGLLANMPEVVLRYRRHPQTVCRQRTEEQNVGIRKAVEEAFRCDGRRMPPLWYVRQRRPKKRKSDYLRDRAVRLLIAGNRWKAIPRATAACFLGPGNLSNWRALTTTLRGDA